MSFIINSLYRYTVTTYLLTAIG